jgi:hypothetical protein
VEPLQESSQIGRTVFKAYRSYMQNLNELYFWIIIAFFLTIGFWIQMLGLDSANNLNTKVVMMVISDSSTSLALGLLTIFFPVFRGGRVNSDSLVSGFSA